MSNCGCSRLWGCNKPIKRNQTTSFLRMCTHSWMQSTSLGKYLGNPFFFIRQFIFLTEENDPFIVGGQGDTVKKQAIEEGDQRLETEQAATSHVGLLSSFDVYFPGVLPAPVCAANNAAQHCWAYHAQCPQSCHSWVTLLTFCAINCHGCLTRPELPHELCFPSAALLDHCFSVCPWLILVLHEKLPDLAKSAALAPSTFSHSLLQGLSSLQPRAILRNQMQA